MATATGGLDAAVKDRLLRSRIAVSVIFFLFGSGYGMWGVHIPLVRARLGIDTGLLGLVLLNIGIGSVIAQPAMGWAIGRIGSRLPATLCVVALAAVLPLPILAPDVPLFFVGAFLFGVAGGLLNVSINTQASEVETLRGAPTMSSFHGFFSLGALAGSASGGLLVGAGWGDGSAALAWAAMAAVVGLLAATGLLRGGAVKPAGPERAFALPGRAVLALAFVAFLCNMIEGAMIDWSALFLSVEKSATASAAADGLALFAGAMAAGRLAGAPFVRRLGERTIVTLGCLLIAAGIGIAIIAPTVELSAVGFALVGIGAANNVPVLIGAAGRTPGMQPGVAVAAVSTAGMVGFLISPPAIGLAANTFGLSFGLGLLAVVGLAAAAASALRR